MDVDNDKNTRKCKRKPHDDHQSSGEVSRNCNFEREGPSKFSVSSSLRSNKKNRFANCVDTAGHATNNDAATNNNSRSTTYDTSAGANSAGSTLLHHHNAVGENDSDVLHSTNNNHRVPSPSEVDNDIANIIGGSNNNLDNLQQPEDSINNPPLRPPPPGYKSWEEANSDVDGYVNRIKSENLIGWTTFISSPALNPKQHFAVESAKKLSGEHFNEVRRWGEACLPDDVGGVGFMPPFESGRGMKLYLIDKPDDRYKKLGRTVMDADGKEHNYVMKFKSDDRFVDGEFTFACVWSVESQDIQNQRKERDLLDIRSALMCQIPLGSLPTMTIRDAVFLELNGLPFITQLHRYTLIYSVDQCNQYGGGARLRGLAYNLEGNDMETGATSVLENSEFFPRNLPQHPHEHLQSSLGCVFNGYE